MTRDKPSVFYVYAQRSTYEFLRESLRVYEHQNIKTRLIVAKDILDRDILNNRHENVLGLFMPGSPAAQLYRDNLGERGKAAIQTYVANGGSYIGICAGAYLASHDIVYKSARRQEHIQDNLALFDGQAIGQLSSLLVPVTTVRQGWEEANVTPLHYHTASGPSTANVIYWGGPAYQPAPHEKITVLATYDAATIDDQPAIAIAAKDYGAGRVVLSGVHPEISASVLLDSAAAKHKDHDLGVFRANLVNLLAPHEAHRQNLFTQMVDQVFLSHNGRIHQKTADFPTCHAAMA